MEGFGLCWLTSLHPPARSRLSSVDHKFLGRGGERPTVQNRGQPCAKPGVTTSVGLLRRVAAFRTCWVAACDGIPNFQSRPSDRCSRSPPIGDHVNGQPPNGPNTPLPSPPRRAARSAYGAARLRWPSPAQGRIFFCRVYADCSCPPGSFGSFGAGRLTIDASRRAAALPSRRSR